jgi:hypothetical protein
MKRKQQRQAPDLPEPEKVRPSKPPWHDLVDAEERPSREDRAAGRGGLVESLLEPVPLPRWLRGRRRAPRDKLS